MTDAGHPSRHGYVQCSWCSTWIPEATACHPAEATKAYLQWLEGNGEKPALDAPECVDSSWCARQLLLKVGA